MFCAVAVFFCSFQRVKCLHLGLISVPASLGISVFAEFLLGAGKIVFRRLQMHCRMISRSGLLGGCYCLPGVTQFLDRRCRLTGRNAEQRRKQSNLQEFLGCRDKYSSCHNIFVSFSCGSRLKLPTGATRRQAQ